MAPDETKRAYRKDMLLASALVAAGLSISGLSLAQIATRNPQVAQATPPLQPSPAPANQDKQPAGARPGEDRPTTPSPQPARLDAQAQKSNATPALLLAPAEKSAPPIPEKE